MGRRRAETLCASLVLSCRARAPRPILSSVRHASNRSSSSSSSSKEPPKALGPRPLRAGYHEVRNDDLGVRTVLYKPTVSSSEPPPKTKRNALPHPRVAVLGGGLTGLTTAFYLAKKLPPTSKIVVYEASDRWGGWIKSERTKVRDEVRDEDPTVLFERGPRSVSLAKTQGRLDKAIVVDILETLGLLPVHPPPDLPRFIWHKGMRQTNNAAHVLTAPAFWQALGEMISNRLKSFFTPRQIPPYGDMSVAAMMYLLLGSKTLIDVPLSALMHGIWGGDVSKLSVLSATGWLYDKTMLDSSKSRFERLQDLRKAPEGSFYYSKREYEFAKRFLNDIKEEGRTDGYMSLLSQTQSTMAHVGPHGLESLPLGLANMLESAPNVELRLGSPVQNVGYSKQRSKMQVHEQKGNVEQYDKVISTLPAEQLSNITDGKLPLAEFSNVSIMTVNIWYPFTMPVHGVGYLIPAATPHEENPERGLGVFYDSSAGIGENRETAPKNQSKSKDDADDTPSEKRLEGGTKLFVLMGGHLYDRDGVQPPSPDEAIEQAKALVQRHMGIPVETPCHAVANLAKNCLPQHNVGHYSRLTALHEDLERHYGKRLAVAGGSFTKPGVAGAMRAGYDIADAVANDDFLATGLEDSIEPEVYAGTPTTIVDGQGDNELFVQLIEGKPKGDR